MRNLALFLKYDGTAYHGWQVQKNACSVAQTLEEAAADVVGHPVHMTGCGRTDAGVHARTYVANFRTESRIPVDRVASQIEEVLSKKLAAYNIELVGASIENMDFTDAFTDAVEAKQVAEQNKLRAETEAQQRVLEATPASDKNLSRRCIRLPPSGITVPCGTYIGVTIKTCLRGSYIMFVMTAKLSKPRLIAAGVLILAVVILVVALVSGGGGGSADAPDGATNDARLAYLAGFGCPAGKSSFFCACPQTQANNGKDFCNDLHD